MYDFKRNVIKTSVYTEMQESHIQFLALFLYLVVK